MEAWLFSEPALFPAEVRKRISGKSAAPEEINLQNPPSKVLQDAYLGALKHEYRKTTTGAGLFSRLNPQLAYERCPGLKRLLDSLLELSRAADFD